MINVSSIAKPGTFVRKMVGIYGQVAKILTFVRKKAGFTDRFPYVRRKILGHMLRFVKS